MNDLSKLPSEQRSYYDALTNDADRAAFLSMDNAARMACLRIAADDKAGRTIPLQTIMSKSGKRLVISGRK